MKYIGSKARFSNEIATILQEYIDNNGIKTYIEPFVGGFNVIDKIKCEKRVGSDIDPLVCNLVETCRENPALLDELKIPTREHYYDVRDNAEKYDEWYRAAILLFASYNARVYGGCYGATATTKDGRIRNYFEESKENFKRQLPLLREILVGCCDYRDLIPPKNETTLIYCDPPYFGGIGYKEKFNTSDFWAWCREQSKTHIVIISEYVAPDDFVCIWEQETQSHLNNRRKVSKTEKLFILRGTKWQK